MLIDMASKQDHLIFEGQENLSMHKLDEDLMLIIDKNIDQHSSSIRLIRFK